MSAGLTYLVDGGSLASYIDGRSVDSLIDRLRLRAGGRVMSELSDPKPDDSIGDGRPPTNSRFKPGRSGNSAGSRGNTPC